MIVGPPTDAHALVAAGRQLEARRCGAHRRRIDPGRPGRGKSGGEVAPVVVAGQIDVQRQRAHLAARDRQDVVDAHDRRARAVRRPLRIDAEPHRPAAKPARAFARDGVGEVEHGLRAPREHLPLRFGQPFAAAHDLEVRVADVREHGDVRPFPKSIFVYLKKLRSVRISIQHLMASLLYSNKKLCQ